MKKLFLLLITTCLSGLNPLAAQTVTPVKEFKLAGPYPLFIPYQTDSVNGQNKKPNDELALTYIPTETNLEPLKTFSDPILHALDNQKTIGKLYFNIDNPKYLVGEIKIKGPKKYQLFVDGEKSDRKIQLDPYTHQLCIAYVQEANARDTLAVSIQANGPVNVTLSNKHRYNTYDCMDGLRATYSSLSPNGKFLLASYRKVEHGGRTTTFHQLKETATGRVVSTFEREINPQWMPKSNCLMYTANESQKRYLYRFNPENSSTVLISSDFPEGNFTLSPNEDYIIIEHEEDGLAEKEEIFEVIEPDDRIPYWRSRSYLSKYDLTTKLLTRLTFGSHSVHLQDISMDGSKLLINVEHSRLTKRPTNVRDLVELNPITLQADTVLQNAEFLNSFAYSPDGKQILISASGESFNGIGLNIKTNQIANMYHYLLYLYDIESKSVKCLTKHFDPSVIQMSWNAFDQLIYFTANNRDFVSMYTLNPKDLSIRALPLKEENIKTFSLATHSNFLSYIGEGSMNPVRMYVVNRKNYAEVYKEDFGKALLKDVIIGSRQDWNFVNAQGDTIYGAYYVPANFDPSQKYPLIVNYYGGTLPTERAFETRYPKQAYTAMGYIVYVIQPSGAVGFGQEFAARHVNTWGQMTAEDIIEGTRKFCDEHPFINRNKIGCIGASYGGFMTQYLQTKTNLFAAAISHAGISNITSYWGEGYWGYSYNEVASAGKYPWNAPDLYTKQSPLFNADKIHTPLLFLHGTADTNVPVGESIQMFNALKLLGRETALVLVNNQNHHITNYRQRVLWQNTIFAWFAKYLQDDATWWNTLYPPKQLGN